jgi:CheY-like chemotaxis protein
MGYEGARRTILVADDQAENRQLLRRMLEPLGFDVALAGDGREVVAASHQRRPDLVVMDLRMPQMNGFEAARAIRQSPGLESVPLVAASASTADLDTPKRIRTPSSRLRRSRLAICSIRFSAPWRRALRGDRHVERWCAHSRSDLSDAPCSGRRAPAEQLLELARLGKLVRVEQIALELEQQEALRPFALRLYGLARRLTRNGHHAVGGVPDQREPSPSEPRATLLIVDDSRRTYA